MATVGPVTAAISSPHQARSLVSLASALLAMAAAFVAPPMGLLVLAALGALGLVSAEQPIRPRLDALALTGLAALAAAAAAAGFAGATGVMFAWFVMESARSQNRRSRALATLAQGGLAERAAIWLAAAFAILLVAAAAPHVVMGVPLNLPHPPVLAIWATGLFYALSVVDWIVRNLARWRLGEGRLAPVAADATFHIVMLAGFALCPDVSAGLAGLVAYRLGLLLKPEALHLGRAQAGA